MQDLVDRTAVIIARGDQAGLASAFAEPDGWHDHQRAYQARCRLAELVLAYRPQTAGTWIAPFVTAARCLLTDLEREPREPLLLKLHGCAALRAGGAVRRGGTVPSWAATRSGAATVRIRGEAGGAADPQLVRLAGQLAVAGDGDPRRAAPHLAGAEALRLPGGDAATVQIDPDESRDAGEVPAGEAAFVLHSPTLGAIEVRLRIGPGAIRAGVVTAPGEPAALAEAELPYLVERLARAAGRPATAAVNARPAGVRPPLPPTGSMSGPAPRRAAALRYEGRRVPRVVASGRGFVAEKIIEAAREAGVPLREDTVLMQALASLELGQEIPPELYLAVAQALAWAYQLSGRSRPRPA